MLGKNIFTKLLHTAFIRDNYIKDEDAWCASLHYILVVRSQYVFKIAIYVDILFLFDFSEQSFLFHYLILGAPVSWEIKGFSYTNDKCMYITI